MQHWMQRTAIAVGLLTVAVLGIVLLGSGAVPGYGFAKASELADQQATLNQILATQRTASIHSIITEIKLTRTTMCEAQRAIPPNGAAFRFASDRLSQLLQDYEQASGRDYSVPDCRQLIIE